MDRKEGGGFWCAQEGGSLKNWQTIFFSYFKIKQQTNKQTNKETNKGFKSLVSLTFCSLILKNQLLIKMFTIKSKICPHPLSTHFPSALLRPWFQCSLVTNVARWVVDCGGLKWVQAGIDCGSGVGV